MMRNFKTETELEPNASRNCFWDGYLERSVSYWPIFFPVPSNSTRSLCES